MSTPNVDFTQELTKLLAFAGDAAAAIRECMAHSLGLTTCGKAPRKLALIALDICSFSEAIGLMLNVGRTLEEGDADDIEFVCNHVQLHLEGSVAPTDSAEASESPAFHYWAATVSPAEAIQALKEIKRKAHCATSAFGANNGFQPRRRQTQEEANRYWADQEWKKYVVTLVCGPKRKRITEDVFVGAKDAESAKASGIDKAIRVLRPTQIAVRLATAQDLGCA